MASSSSSSWVLYHSEQGYPYYYNIVTQESTWTLPDNAAVAGGEASHEPSQFVPDASANAAQPEGVDATGDRSSETDTRPEAGADGQPPFDGVADLASPTSEVPLNGHVAHRQSRGLSTTLDSNPMFVGDGQIAQRQSRGMSTSFDTNPVFVGAPAMQSTSQVDQLHLLYGDINLDEYEISAAAAAVVPKRPPPEPSPAVFQRSVSQDQTCCSRTQQCWSTFRRNPKKWCRGFGKSALQAPKRFWVWLNEEPKQEHCKCCRRYPRCQKFFSNRKVRVVLCLLALIFFIWAIYAIWAIIELLKIANSKSTLSTLVIPDLCTSAVSLNGQFVIRNPSKLGLNIHSLRLRPRYQGSTIDIGSIEVVPIFQATGDTNLQSGYNVLDFATYFHVESVSALGQLLSLVLSDAKAIPVVMAYTVDISTDAFWFPLRMELSGTMITLVNDPNTQQSDPEEPVEEAPSPSLNEVQFANTTEVVASDGNLLLVYGTWNLFAWKRGVNVTVPPLFVDAYSNNSYLAAVDIVPFFYAWDTNATAKISVQNLTDNAISTYQNILDYFSTNTTFYLQVGGNYPRSAAQNHSTCMIQQAVNSMPTASILVVPDPAPKCPGDPACDTSNTPIAMPDSASGGSSTSTKKSSSVILHQVALANITRARGSRLTAIVDVTAKLNFKFLIWGQVPSLYFDILTTQLHVITLSIPAFRKPRDWTPTTARVSVRCDDEPLMVSRAASSKPVSSWRLQLRGQRGRNLVSTILGGLRVNLTDSASSGSPASKFSSMSAGPWWKSVRNFLFAVLPESQSSSRAVYRPHLEPYSILDLVWPRDLDLRATRNKKMRCEVTGCSATRLAEYGNSPFSDHHGFHTFGSSSGTTSTTTSDGVVLTVDYGANYFGVNVSLSLNTTGIGFKLRVNPLSVFFWKGVLQDSASNALYISMDAINVGSIPADDGTVIPDNSTDALQIVLRVSMNTTQGYNLGTLVNDFTNSRDVVFSTQNSVFGYLPVSVFANFTSDDLDHALSLSDQLSDSGTSSGTSSSSNTTTYATFELQEVAPSRWLRLWDASAPGYAYHGLGFNVSMSSEFFIELRGRLPAISLYIQSLAGQSILNITAAPQIVAPGQLKKGRLVVGIVAETVNEAAVYQLAGNVSSEPQVKVRIGGRRGDITSPLVPSAYGAESPLNTFLAAMSLSLVVSQSNTTSSGGSSSSSSLNFLNILDTSLLDVVATHGATWGNISANMDLPAFDFPFDISLGQLQAAVDHKVGGSFGSVWRMMQVSALPLALYKSGRPQNLNLSMASIQADAGENLSIFMRDFLDTSSAAASRIPLRFYGSWGNMSVDVSFDAKLNFSAQSYVSQATSAVWTAVYRNVTKSPPCLTGSLSSNNCTRFGVNGFHIVSSDPPGGKVIIPCVLNTWLCPYDSSSLTSSNARLKFNISYVWIYPFALRLRAPRLTADFDCCIHEQLITVALDAFTYDSRSYNISVDLVVTFQNLPLIQSAVKELTNLYFDFDFRIHGSKVVNVGLFSTMFKRYDGVITIPAGNVTLSGQQNQVQLSPGVKYELTATTSNSASFNVYVSFDSPFRFAVNLGQANANLYYAGYQWGTVGVLANIKPGTNAMKFVLSLVGQSSIPSYCTSYPISNKAFCVANEVISRLLAKELYPDGTAVKLDIGLINLYGTPVTVSSDLMLFAVDPNDRNPTIPKSLGMLQDYGVNFGSTLSNMLSGLFTSSFDISVYLVIKNVFNITVAFQDASLDFYQDDFDGVADYTLIPGTPMAANTQFLLASNLRQTWGAPGLVAPSGGTASSSLTATFSWSSTGDAVRRIYDDYVVQNRLCVSFLNGRATLQLQYQTQTPLVFTQLFNIYDYSAVNNDDCARESACRPDMYDVVVTGFNSGWTFNRDAYNSGGVLSLADGSSDLSSAWYNTKLQALERWEVEFSFRMNDDSWFNLGCADGIVFVVQNSPSGTSALGTSSSSSSLYHGYRGITNSAAVALDCYLTNECILSEGGTGAVNVETENIPEYDDGNWHTARVHYNNVYKRMSAYIDNQFAAIGQVIMEDYGMDSSGKGYFGFTGSSGSSYYYDLWVGSFTYRKLKISATKSKVQYNGNVLGRVGQTSNLLIESFDTCGKPRIEGISGGTMGVYFKYSTGTTVNALSVTDNKNGYFSVSFNLPLAGSWDVYISITSPYSESGKTGYIQIIPVS